MQKTPRSWTFLPKTILVVALGLTTLIGMTASAVDVVTEPVGFYKTALLTNSDTRLSFPFTRVPEFVGAVASVSGNDITVSGSPAWANDVWATPIVTANSPLSLYPYFVMLTSGAKNGAFYTITNNTADTLSAVLVPENLTGVAASDSLRIIPFWTLNTTFPSGTGVVTSTSTSLRKTELLFPNLAGLGNNLPAGATYFYFNNAWRRQGVSSVSNYNDQVILPDQHIIARQSSNADTSTNLVAGQVVMSKVRIPLYTWVTNANVKQDNYIGLYRPAVQTLDQSDLTNAFQASTSTSLRKDELLTYDNTVQLKNKAASGTYYYFNNGWRKQGVSSTINFGPSNIFLVGTGVIVRKSTNTYSSTIWVNSPNYSN